jgi:hypothetical protein
MIARAIHVALPGGGGPKMRVRAGGALAGTLVSDDAIPVACPQRRQKRSAGSNAAPHCVQKLGMPMHAA